LLAHGRWFSPASSITKTGRHDIAEILLKVALNTIKQTNKHKTMLTQVDEDILEAVKRKTHDKGHVQKWMVEQNRSDKLYHIMLY
jgi:hypothetical protein